MLVQFSDSLINGRMHGSALAAGDQGRLVLGLVHYGIRIIDSHWTCNQSRNDKLRVKEYNYILW